MIARARSYRDLQWRRRPVNRDQSDGPQKVWTSRCGRYQIVRSKLSETLWAWHAQVVDARGTGLLTGGRRPRIGPGRQPRTRDEAIARCERHRLTSAGTANL